ncbi:MAG: aspartate aminotransferase family protein [Rhodospirillaceae bacterium]|nr:aspartate aminotransferase family protein [Rhodospirillaceae bacterium]MBT5877914.1 aspartate aminotransferase family protein [Rhodospirillaceae bacterium]MBT6589191.1 aspartate aminotransferase family protein [Rhodospirillaceae bacterium]MBT6913649.1 aspartate aminotransferase family protein [Rhodospirillaceae bacterium]MBT7287168.1 aspartate aminotransferase family protein [Rhodospirillaceae bacterium]
MDELLNDAARRAQAYLKGLDNRAVAPSAEALAALSELAGPWSEQGMDATEVLAKLDRLGGPATMASAGARYFGFVTGGSLPVALAANWLSAAWDQNAFSTVSSPLAASLEIACLGWLRQIFGLPKTAGGAFVTGATMANFTGLAAARHAVLARVGWDVEQGGLFGAPPITILVGDEGHAALLKAVRMLGLGEARVKRLAVDDQGAIRGDSLPSISGPTILCLQAGNVNSGAFDPADQLIPQAQGMGAWVHVDGAFGIWAKAASHRASLAAGYELADSLAVDGHKWLNVPYDSGIALVREPGALRAAMSITAAYLPEGSVREPYDFTPECSRRMRGADIWAALAYLGQKGLADLVETCCRHAAMMAKGLQASGYEVLNEVKLNQVLVSFGADETTERVIAGLQADGTAWCGGTHWHGRAAMRISFSSHATTDADVVKSLEAILRVAASNSTASDNTG